MSMHTYIYYMPVVHVSDPQNYYVNLLDGRNSKMAQ